MDLNLTPHRHAVSVWSRPGWNGRPESEFGSAWIVGIAGGLVVAEALRRRASAAALIASAGTAIAWWALAHRSTSLSWRDRLRLGRTGGDQVQDASADSFPASDAPSWTPTVGTGLRFRTWGER